MFSMIADSQIKPNGEFVNGHPVYQAGSAQRWGIRLDTIVCVGLATAAFFATAPATVTVLAVAATVEAMPLLNVAKTAIAASCNGKAKAPFYQKYNPCICCG